MRDMGVEMRPSMSKDTFKRLSSKVDKTMLKVSLFIIFLLIAIMFYVMMVNKNYF